MTRVLYYVACLSLVFLVACDKQEEQLHGSASMIKAVHYFADAWPKTFWQEFEVSKLEADIQQIREDGFNTVVLAVPWMGFESGFTSDQTQSDPRLYQRLELLLDRFGKAGLGYILRVGYPHDFTPGMDRNNVQLCLDMYSDEAALKHWTDYLNKLRRVTDRHQRSQRGILISWEDFWCVHFVFPNESAERRQWLAEKLNYGEWLRTRHADVARILMAENQIDFNKVAIPSKQETAYYLYMEFINEILAERILGATKTVFPEAAMEVRVDRDPVHTANGVVWMDNDLFLTEKNHRGTYWAPFWGARNVGETLTADQALATFEYFLRYVSGDGTAVNHVIDQFNFSDNTPYFPDNAQIDVAFLPEFLERAVPLIRKYSAGYGLWAYRDYADNALYNASFEFGLEGWSVDGPVEVLPMKEENRLSMKTGGRISQSFLPANRFMLSRVYDKLTLCLQSDSDGKAVIAESDSVQAEIDVTEGRSCHDFEASAFTQKEEPRFVFEARSELVLDELRLFGFVQSLGVYDMNGNPGPFLDDVRRMNEMLDSAGPDVP